METALFVYSEVTTCLKLKVRMSMYSEIHTGADNDGIIVSSVHCLAKQTLFFHQAMHNVVLFIWALCDSVNMQGKSPGEFPSYYLVGNHPSSMWQTWLITIFMDQHYSAKICTRKKYNFIAAHMNLHVGVIGNMVLHGFSAHGLYTIQ